MIGGCLSHYEQLSSEVFSLTLKRMTQGWVKLHRGLGEWEWFQDRNTLQLFIFLLINANHKENKWRGSVVPKGCLITGRKSLSEKLGLSEQQVRTSLNKLKSTSEITIKTTSKFSLIKINNWDTYQQDNQQSNKRVTNKQPTSNHKQECKNEKNEKKRESLQLQLKKYENDYSQSMLEDFDLFWGAIAKNGNPLWENQKTWDLPRRLRTWKKKEEKWDWERSQARQLKEVNEMPTKERPAGADSGMSSLGDLLTKRN